LLDQKETKDAGESADGDLQTSKTSVYYEEKQEEKWKLRGIAEGEEKRRQQSFAAANRQKAPGESPLDTRPTSRGKQRGS